MNASETGHFLQPFIGQFVPLLYTKTYLWTAFGLLGNLLFSSRFLFQWIASERRRELIVPSYFWHLSFWGSVVNFVYALHIDNAPFFLGVAALPFIYGRNLVLLRKTESKTIARPTNARTISRGQSGLQTKAA